ncbi:hypothetical protein SAMN05421780_10146 [Flexibacter flexilis DSM 6793]|uniref:Uncharacterized protein n=1 Tax=Flexibacter flexilis DSM 6793 TaxID=927664 RepID=A0A1I1D8W6_9BACT|nr:hypothetical protein SAMN05421780_10146 [Flexibacter flexilis DSM 6793]
MYQLTIWSILVHKIKSNIKRGLTLLFYQKNKHNSSHIVQNTLSGGKQK